MTIHSRYLEAVITDALADAKSRLTPAERRTATALWTYADPVTLTAAPGPARLSEAAGLGRQGVPNHLRALVRKGWLVKVDSGGGGSASLFQLVIPATHPAFTDDAERGHRA